MVCCNVQFTDLHILNRTIHSTNIFVARFRMKVTLFCLMNLQKFPFDQQQCPLVLESCKYIYIHTHTHTLSLPLPLSLSPSLPLPSLSLMLLPGEGNNQNCEKSFVSDKKENTDQANYVLQLHGSGKLRVATTRIRQITCCNYTDQAM